MSLGSVYSNTAKQQRRRVPHRAQTAGVARIAHRHRTVPALAHACVDDVLPVLDTTRVHVVSEVTGKRAHPVRPGPRPAWLIPDIRQEALATE